MCSISEDEVTEMARGEIKVLTENDICRKCKVNKAEIILREKDFYCPDCFLVYFEHKFRSTIGKSREIKHGDKILLVYTGDLSSSTLLQLVKTGCDDSSMKKLRFEPTILFINETSINSESPSNESVHSVLSKLDIPFYYVYFEDVMKPANEQLMIYTSDIMKNITNGEEQVSKDVGLANELEIMLSKLKSQTSVDDCILQLRQELISRCANQIGFKKVFLADNGTELAVRILNDIAVGRGSQLSDHVHFKTKIFGIEIFRPMREIFEDEIQYYSVCEKLVSPRREATQNSGEKAPNISSCTRNFVLGLQKEFFSTVPTIFKTGGKLVSGNSNGSTSLSQTMSDVIDEEVSSQTEECSFVSRETCLFCGCSKNVANGSLSSVEAVKVSKLLSTTAAPHLRSENGVVEGEGGGVSSHHVQEGEELTEEELHLFFCYGCRTLCREMRTLEDFPPRIREKLNEAQKQNFTLNLIQDCLL